MVYNSYYNNYESRLIASFLHVGTHRLGETEKAAGGPWLASRMLRRH